MRIEAKRRGSSTDSCHHIFDHEDNSIYNSPPKPDCCSPYESLALQDHNNKAPDDELATVPCLDIEA